MQVLSSDYTTDINIYLKHNVNLPNEMASITQTNIVILCFVSKLQKMKIETDMYYDMM